MEMDTDDPFTEIAKSREGSKIEGNAVWPLKIVNEKSNVEDKLICKPIQSFHRDGNIVPFHIPHKKLLEKIDYKRAPPEPLAGFADYQQNLLSYKESPMESMVESEQESEMGSGEVSRFGLKFKREETTGGPSAVSKDPIFPHERLSDVMDQGEWIEKIREMKDGYFIYMTYTVRKASEQYSPYALSIVLFPNVDKSNFFTMSSKGVMQHIGVETVFTLLDVWERECKMYCKLMHYRTFYRFRLWKGFTVWRKAVVRKKFKAAQTILNDNLFI